MGDFLSPENALNNICVLFQAPHAHCLLYIVDEQGNEAPTLADVKAGDSNSETSNQQLFEEIENMNDDLISASVDDAVCPVHEDLGFDSNCDECTKLRDCVLSFQVHKRSFTCVKKNKFLRIHPKEGLGINVTEDKDELVIPICRFGFPKSPMLKTKYLLAISKNEDEKEVNQMRKDYRHIKCYDARHTQYHDTKENEADWRKYEKMTFFEYLEDLGMFKDISSSLPEEERKEKANERYMNALRVGIKGSAQVFLKRGTKDVFINNYNRILMLLVKSNHDIQYVSEMHAVANYLTNYMTKVEQAASPLMKSVEEATRNLPVMKKMRSLATVVDKKRESSIQECVYQIAGLPMSKFSIKVKYISTSHPKFRDGLLRGNIKDLDDNDPVLHFSIHQYYELRPEDTDDVDWESLSLAEFVAYYEITKNPSLRKKEMLIPLQENSGFTYRRSTTAVIRYYLNYEEPEDLARGLLILFVPFRDEFEDIHDKNVLDLVDLNKDLIEEKRNLFEKNVKLIGLIEEIQKLNQEREEEDEDEDPDQDRDLEGETTSEQNIEEFIKSAKANAKSQISSSIDMTVPTKDTLKERSILLNKGQRKLFQDICERYTCGHISQKPFYLFLSGEAGTGAKTTY